MKPIPENSKEDLAIAVRVGSRLQKIARLIEKELEKVGAPRGHTTFSLLVWGPGRTQYVSTAEREDVRKAVIEMVGKWTAEQDLGVPTLPLGGLNHEH